MQLAEILAEVAVEGCALVRVLAVAHLLDEAKPDVESLGKRACAVVLRVEIGGYRRVVGARSLIDFEGEFFSELLELVAALAHRLENRGIVCSS